MNKKDTESWEERLSKLLIRPSNAAHWYDYQQDIFSFIKELLEKERELAHQELHDNLEESMKQGAELIDLAKEAERKRVKDEVIGIVEGMKRNEENFFRSSKITGNEDMSVEGTLRRNNKISEEYGNMNGYNQAIDDIINFLKNQ